MKTIAIIESCDTKFKEAKFISDFIKNEDLNTIVINTATGPQPSYNYDIQVIAKQAQDMSQNSAETWDFRILGIAKN